MRIALGIEYDGTAYNGWQRQCRGHGVQERVEAALSEVADEPIEIVCAGRTDTGVHASGQVIHFDAVADRSERSWQLGANTNLPDDISVTWARRVSDDFHARFSATARGYQYRILNRLARSALYHKRAWWVYEPLDFDAMQAAGETLLGKHDFSAFRAAGCQASQAVRVVTSLRLRRDGDWIWLDITANAFLMHMVRNIMGTLIAVGKGDQRPEWVADVLGGRDRTVGGITAPAHGLTLVSVEYPEVFGLPS